VGGTRSALAPPDRSERRSVTSLRDELVLRLEQENDELRARVRELEAERGIGFEVPIQFRLSRQEAALFGLLMKNPLVSKEFAIRALYLHQQDEAEIKIIDVFVCKIRAKLKPWNIEIGTQWGQGYFIPADSKAIAQRLIDDLNGVPREAVA
jgi:two-component system cell cycle response regulator CtrA